jgi:hypothetical protein
MKRTVFGYIGLPLVYSDKNKLFIARWWVSLKKSVIARRPEFKADVAI